ncbi:MAG: CidA/LrgA family protein [Eubacterium sp.]|nr:CidA/LrgA family protein [Eubacterium sp.]MBR6171677.1 CidA/LrgA family protein [Eubacterium sp.]
MKYLKQFLIILAISFAGETLYHLIPLPIPASIYGILILFTLLETKLLPLSAVKETGKFLIEIMPVMFIPAAVGLLESWSILKASWVSYAVITVCTTFLVMLVSGHVTQAVMRLGRRKKGSGPNGEEVKA